MKTDHTKTKDDKGSSTQTEFHNFFVDQLKDIYWAEKHLKKGLRKMSRAATSPKLRDAFEKHYDEGDKQITELETIFGLLGEKPEAKRCEAMEGLLEEADGMISDTQKNSFVRDAGLILAAQKVEHYEIATYGTLSALAAYLPEKKVRRMLETILAGEKKTDELLTRIAEEFVNECAAVE
ncbi:MAG: ferritin-like domain-containing protein [Alistipes sp.]|nr:ferritin-like domain-containing protein [Alistipes sp.]